MAEESFELSDVFEDLVDWPKRLAGEEPFFRRLFAEVGARSVLDSACGTGRHAALFHSWGLRVEGADVSPRMVERARASFGEPDGLHWTVRGYEEPVRAQEPFDVVLCVGNSLAMAPDKEVVRRAVGAMTAAVRTGGAVVVHLLNVWRFPEGPGIWQKCRRADRQDGDALIVKGVHRCGSRAYAELILAPIGNPELMRSTHLTLVCLEAPEMEEMFRRSGARKVELHGGYDGRSYDREESVDLVLTIFT